MCDNSHLSDVWSEDMLYYYCGMLMDRYINRDVRLGLYRDSKRHGPDGNLDCIFHPIMYKGNWHLLIFRKSLDEVLYVDCSGKDDELVNFEAEDLTLLGDLDFLQKVGKLKASEPIPQNLILQKNQFKLTKVFTRVSLCNSINLLAVIYGICCTKNILDYLSGIHGKYNKFDVTLFYTQDLATFDRHLIDKISLGEAFYLTLKKSLEGKSPISSKRQGNGDIITFEPDSKRLKAPVLKKLPSELTALKVTNVSILNQIKDTPEYALIPSEKTFIKQEMATKIIDVLKPDMVGFEQPEVLDGVLDFLQKVLSSSYAREKYSECDIMCKDVVNSSFSASKSKRIFDYDEEYFLEDLKIDNKHQLYPVFVHQSQLYIVEFVPDKIKEYGDTTINIVEITRKGQPREILANPMLKKLSERYAFYHNRKIAVVNANKIFISDISLFSMIFTMFSLVAHSIKHGEFSLSYTPNPKQVQLFSESLLEMAAGIKENDIRSRNSSFRKLMHCID